MIFDINLKTYLKTREQPLAQNILQTSKVS